MQKCSRFSFPISKPTTAYSVPPPFQGIPYPPGHDQHTVENKHSVVQHPSSSGVASMIYPPSFFSPLRVLSISKIFISLKIVYLTMVGKFFKFMVYRLLENSFVSQKILSRHFYHSPNL